MQIMQPFYDSLPATIANTIINSSWLPAVAHEIVKTWLETLVAVIEETGRRSDAATRVCIEMAHLQGV